METYQESILKRFEDAYKRVLYDNSWCIKLYTYEDKLYTAYNVHMTYESIRNDLM